MTEDITAPATSADIAQRLVCVVRDWFVFDTSSPTDMPQGTSRIIAIRVDVGEPLLSDGRGDTIISTATATVTLACASDDVDALVHASSLVSAELARPHDIILSSHPATSSPELDEAGASITITSPMEVMRAVDEVQLDND